MIHTWVTSELNNTEKHITIDCFPGKSSEIFPKAKQGYALPAAEKQPDPGQTVELGAW